MSAIRIYDGPSDMTVSLTTESPMSHHGVPVLRIEGEGFEDMGPADQLPSGMLAADFVCRWAEGGDPDAGTFAECTAEGRRMARAFCAQWPAGPQIARDIEREDPTGRPQGRPAVDEHTVE